MAMRAAEILVEMLLDEAGETLVWALGPKLPPEGAVFYVRSDTEAIAKMVQWLKPQYRSGSNSAIISALLYFGYSMLVRNAKGRYLFYGDEKKFHVTDDMVYAMGLTKATVIRTFVRGNDGSIKPGRITNGRAIGVT